MTLPPRRGCSESTGVLETGCSELSECFGFLVSDTLPRLILVHETYSRRFHAAEQVDRAAIARLVVER